MHFPLLNVSEKKWKDEDLMDYLLIDEYIYTDSKTFWDTFIHNKLFCDCKGQLYVIDGKELPNSWWRKVFKWLPNVYKIKLRFKNTGKQLSLEELRKYLLARIHDLSDYEGREKWIQFIQQANSYEQLIGGQMDD